MKRMLISAAALVVLAFSLFGFLATFEPLERSAQILWRSIYTLLSLGALATLYALRRTPRAR